jgi:hypothetical protein
MTTCEAELWDLVRRIEPTRTQKAGAKRSQKRLREVLCTGNMQARITATYLSGSYARNTAIYPLDDVDIIFVIDPTYWIDPFAAFAKKLFFGPGSEAYPSPSTVLESFARAIRYRYPVSSVHGQRRSVGLKLYHLDIDVVPAIIDKKAPRQIRIPDSETEQWILTSPKQHSENATAVNKKNEGRFKPLVKLLKHWNYNLPSTAYLKSFAIETVSVRLFGQTDLLSLQEGLYQFFDFIAHISGNETHFDWKSKYGMSLGWLGSTIPDAAETGTNVVKGLEDDRRRRFIENAIRSRNKMAESLKTQSLETACRKVSEALKL